MFHERRFCKARLKNFAVSSGCTFQDALVYYGLERTIYRISVSPYASHFVLKGGIFLYAIFDRKYERATTDVDLLARRISNSAEEMKDVFRNIFAQDTDDALVFDLDSITAEDITEFKEYHGLHISAVAYLDRTRIPIGIDIGFGDVIYPDAVEMEFPVILDMEAPKVNAYSLESSIAEKLEAIVKNGFLNSRYKDFYDIYVLSKKYPFNYEKLNNAVTETFTNRKTPITMETAAFSNEFLSDSMHQTRWNSFLKKKKAMIPVSMNDAMTRIKTFVTPLLTQNSVPVTEWDPNGGSVGSDDKHTGSHPTQEGKQHHKADIQHKSFPAHSNLQCSEICNLSSWTGNHKGCCTSHAHAFPQPLLQKGYRSTTASIKRHTNGGCHQYTPCFISAKHIHHNILRHIPLK